METRILIADDEAHHRNAIRTKLRELNKETAFHPVKSILAASGEQVLDTVREYLNRKQVIDLILLDWDMPALNGIQTLEQLKNPENPEMKAIPVIMVTSHASPERIALAFKMGASDYVIKPAEEVVFLARVRNVIKTNRTLNQNEELLGNLLPPEIIQELKIYNQVESKEYDAVTVIATNFHNFNHIASSMEPSEMLGELDFCFCRFDEITERNQLEKIKIIGERYICAGGVPRANQLHAIQGVLAGLEMQRFLLEHRRGQIGDYWQINIGISTGAIIGGVISEHRLSYDIWGNPVNEANLLATSGEVGQINITQSTYELIKDFFDCSSESTLNTHHRESETTYYKVRGIKAHLSKAKAGLVPNDSFKNQLLNYLQDTTPDTILDRENTIIIHGDMLVVNQKGDKLVYVEKNQGGSINMN